MEDITLPEALVTIGESVFEGCTGLMTVELPQTVITIRDRAFYGCTQINDITLPEHLEQIGNSAFQNCSGLTGIDIPASVIHIGDSAFYESMMLTATVPISFTDDVARYFPDTCEITYTGYEKLELHGEVGDIITFGTYEQDNDLANGSEPLEWQILEKDGTKLYVISKYGLDSQKYHDKWEVVVWETSKIRVWLNQTFYTTAFNPVEQGMIITSDVRSIHPIGSYPSNTVQDKVFLLDYEGAYGYFKGEKARTCIATAYAAAQGSSVEYGNRCWWWLREKTMTLLNIVYHPPSNV